ncbi:hypothetical protein F5Y15DRAFT_421707 [Xylariaceae sp. FL0016]|nr:hypothetical protein F5Y15DRAFT_421707 [Xylariaceae sp. FL0016]
MQLGFILSAVVATLSFTGLATATPMRCPDETRDLILKGILPPETCCSYGFCKNDVVVAMHEWQARNNPGSALRYNTR